VTTTERDAAKGLRLTVLSPGGRDPDQDFAEDIPGPNERTHPPLNFHGYAACTRGAFLRDIRRAVEAGRPVLLLLRGDFKQIGRASCRERV